MRLTKHWVMPLHDTSPVERHANTPQSCCTLERGLTNVEHVYALLLDIFTSWPTRPNSESTIISD
jgi:hypothetical protein